MKCKYDIYDDLYRYTGKRTFFLLMRYVIFTPGFRYIYFFRKHQNSNNILFKLFLKFLIRRVMFQTGIQIPPEILIEKGFRIVHFGHIVVNPRVIIGKNFNISQGVTIGYSEGKKAGVPSIGDNVVIQANAVLVGNIKIGSNVVIAPNAFVNIDVPEGCIAIGNPATIIHKNNASAKYIVYKL